jgi:hypothetical protein
LNTLEEMKAVQEGEVAAKDDRLIAQRMFPHLLWLFHEGARVVIQGVGSGLNLGVELK